MASGIVHLAIIEKIGERYNFKDRNRLNFGAVLPDFAKDRQAAHFRAVLWGRNKRTYDLNRFRAKFGAKLFEDDLYLGYYLHLVQDVCHRQIVYDRYHWNPLITENVKRLHNDYAILNRYVREKYGLRNNLVIPKGFSDEELAGITEYCPEGLMDAMDGFFRETGEGEIFFFTEQMTDEFIAEAAELCIREIEALKAGTSVVDSYDLAWENPPYSLLETTRNTRDLGGYRIGEWCNRFGEGSKEDRLIKKHRFLRSDAALEPSAKDIEFLLSSGITTVIDTRTVPETIEKRPHGLRDTEGFHYYNFPIEEGASVPESVEAVPGSYMKIAHSKSITDIFRCIAEAPGGVIENCSAGKDRTGVISALLLWLCGVRKQDIVYDYMRTKENNRERFKLIRYNNPDIDMNIVIPRESFLTDFMDLIVEKHGTVEGYFESVGIGPELQDRLKRKLCDGTLYVTDLDGTLMRNDEKLSAYTVRTINELIEKGLSFTYATARSVESAVPITGGLRMKLPAITRNGAVLADNATGKHLEKAVFTAEEAEMLKAIPELPYYGFVSCFLGEQMHRLYIDGPRSEALQGYVDYYASNPTVRPVATVEELFCGIPGYVTLVGPKEEIRPVYERVKEYKGWETLFQKDTYRDEYWLEICPQNCTKAKTVLKLKERYGYDRVVVFGDGINDIPMFEIADEAYAVSNALAELKQYATGIIGSNEEDAVADFLKNAFATHVPC